MADTDRIIAEQSAALSKEAARRLPADVLGALEGERHRLIDRGIPAGVATAGTAMPDADLLDAHGKPTTLNDARADRPAVIVFYRGAWCPYCNVTLRTYQQKLLGELDARGVALVAVSPENPDGSLTLTEKHELGYAVLSDAGNQLAHALGIVFTLGEGARGGQAKLGLDLAKTNADGSYELPLTTTVVVDASGTIRWIDVHPDYTTRSEPAEILAAVDAL